MTYGSNKVKARDLLIAAYPKIVELVNNLNISEVERIYAKFVIGAYCYFGLGNIEKDHKMAFKIIKECAELGHIVVIYVLGANFYFYGNGTSVNYELADYYLNIAKENGLPRTVGLFKSRKES